MSASTKRLMITVPLEICAELDKLKETAAFEKMSQSEMLRQLLRMGLETARKEDAGPNMFAAVGRH